MRWRNRGHEFDTEWIFRKKLIIFGCGNRGKAFLQLYRRYITSDEDLAFFDNHSGLWGKKVDGIIVKNPDNLKSEKSCVIVVTPDKGKGIEIASQLESYGLIRNSDYFFLHDFVNDYLKAWILYRWEYLIDDYVQISLTERCTLKCKYCAHSCPYRPRGTDDELTYSEAQKSVDMYFNIVDYCDSFDILGGEPLLCSYLNRLLNYIGDKYRDRIGSLTITTNATIIPDGEILRSCCKYDVEFLISDYRHNIDDFSKKAKSLSERLDDNEISYKYVYSGSSKWVDFGFLDVNENELYGLKTFNECKSTCREIRRNKYYYCIMARCASEVLLDDIGISDYLDLKLLDKDSLNDKLVFYEYSHGFSEKGYLEVCKHCRGLNASEQWLIWPGEQLQK